MINSQIRFESTRDDLNPQPIDASWITEGNPLARIKFMSGSSDGTANTYIWDCTAGRFNWKYSFDETACVLEGSVIVKDESGVPHTLKAGDTMFFPAGSNADWHVPVYVRKVAFLRYPMAAPLVLLYRIYNKLKRMSRGEKSNTGSSAGF